jgi:hypothetical protein
MEVSNWQLAAIGNWQLAICCNWQLAKASPVLGIGTWHFYDGKRNSRSYRWTDRAISQRRDSRLLALLVRSRSG